MGFGFQRDLPKRLINAFEGGVIAILARRLLHVLMLRMHWVLQYLNLHRIWKDERSGILNRRRDN